VSDHHPGDLACIDVMTDRAEIAEERAARAEAQRHRLRAALERIAAEAAVEESCCGRNGGQRCPWVHMLRTVAEAALKEAGE
jgi:hypothetical protein